MYQFSSVSSALPVLLAHCDRRVPARSQLDSCSLPGRPALPGIEADRTERWLAAQSLSGGSVGVFTYNDFTRFFARRLLLAFRSAGLSEVVVFKDPRLPPYLCDAPARQKRFRRPPP